MTFTFIAHRGASADAPDNTTAAFQLAIEQQSDMIETDVQITEDGVLVLEHDFDVSGHPVAASRLSELRALKPDLLTVAATLRDFGGRIPFCWEVKAPGVETALVNLVRDLLPEAMWARTHFTSFWFGSAVKVRQLAPDVTVGWLTRDWSEAAIAQVKDAGLTQICPPAEAALHHPALVEAAHAAGLQVRVWLVTGPQLVPDLAAAGVYGGTVNWPAQARAALSGS
jgi:glycerophosphoryl diester phosphodiesterase